MAMSLRCAATPSAVKPRVASRQAVKVHAAAKPQAKVGLPRVGARGPGASSQLEQDWRSWTKRDRQQQQAEPLMATAAGGGQEEEARKQPG